jgi:hypothetical protein
MSQKVYNYSGFEITMRATTARIIKQNTFEIFTASDGGIGIGKESYVYISDKYQFPMASEHFQDVVIGYSTNGANSVWGENTLESGGFFIYKDGKSSTVTQTSPIIPRSYIVTDPAPPESTPPKSTPADTPADAPESTSSIYIWVVIFIIAAMIVVGIVVANRYLSSGPK